MLGGRRPVERTMEFEVGVVSEAGQRERGSADAGEEKKLGDLRTNEDDHSGIRPAASAGGERRLSGVAERGGGGGGPVGRSDSIGAGTGGAGHGGEVRELAGGSAVGCLWGVGAGQRASSYVYVLDRSGSMQDSFHLLQRELIRTIGSLRADQSFDVIWFSEGPCEMLSPAMLAATDENKRRALEAIRGIQPGGRTQPLDAVRRGLSLHPAVMYLLTDGDFGEQNQAVLDEIAGRRAEPARTVVNTILFAFDGGDAGEQALRRIAEVGGGAYKRLTQDRADE